MRLISKIASTAALLAVSSMAFAKDGAYVSFNTGIADVKGPDSVNKGLRLGAAAGYNIGEQFAVELNYQFQKNTGLFTDGSGSARLNNHQVFVNGYAFIPHSIQGLEKLKPYVGVGVGMLRVNAKAEGETVKYNRFAVQGIVGAKYEICETFDAFADFTYSYSKIEGNSYKPYGLRVGAAYKF